jgi:plasmid stabilization system protein ParE
MAARYAVTLAPEAVVEAIRIATWWRRNRRAAPRLFQLELDAALVHLADHPAIGRRADSHRIHNARVLLLRRSGYIVFYQVDTAAHAVLIVHIRHARRRPQRPR